MSESEHHNGKFNFVLEIISTYTSEVVLSINVPNESEHSLQQTKVAIERVIGTHSHKVKYYKGITPIEIAPKKGIFELRKLKHRTIKNGNFARCIIPHEGLKVTDVYWVKGISKSGDKFTLAKPANIEFPEYLFAPYN